MKVACTVLEGPGVGNDLRLLNTTTKISAGMAFLSHGVIAGGRIQYKQTWNLEEGAISRLKNNMFLLNKVGKLLRDEPELGRVMAMRKHVYMGKLNVRKMAQEKRNIQRLSSRVKIPPC